MEGLKNWGDRQLAEQLTEPNSGLGKPIQYLRNHWNPLTLFLSQAGAPLDNNICERALKCVIPHRKNALFYRSVAGANKMLAIRCCKLQASGRFEDFFERRSRRKAAA